MTSKRNARPQRPAAPRRGGASGGGAAHKTGRPPAGSHNGDGRTGAGRALAGSPGRPNAPQRRLKEVRARQARRRARRATLLWSVAAAVIGALIIGAVLVTRSGPLQHTMVRSAPAFTLTATNGTTVSLASFRGHDVVLYFNEGVGCDACFYQMREFEQHAAELRKAGITILPVVMNPASQVRPELASFGLHTPYLIDITGAVSRAYGVLGKGMHAGLPGHGFVLIDARGTERWYGEYPSMYLSSAGLIAEVHAHLRA